jgi:23S rRNA pseudouridine2457 synthase
MAKIILLNKPFNTLCQFTDKEGRATLKDYLPNQPGFHAAGRLDYDSEGLLLLTDNGALQNRITDPKHKLAKTYWVQVEGDISHEAITQLQQGLLLKDGKTRPAKATKIQAPELWPRNPPIRERANIPTSWLSLTITEGKNRQVRRMTAAVGFPTLRLIRIQIGQWQLADLQPGEHRIEQIHLPTPSSKKPRR